MKRIGLALLFLCAAAQAQVALPPEEVFRPSVRYVDAKTVELRYDIAPGHYLYRDKFSFSAEPAGLKLGKPSLPRGQIRDDKFFGKVETYHQQVLIRFAAPAAESWVLNATSQGCFEDKVCYPPTTQKLEVRRPGSI